MANVPTSTTNGLKITYKHNFTFIRMGTCWPKSCLFEQYRAVGSCILWHDVRHLGPSRSGTQRRGCVDQIALDRERTAPTDHTAPADRRRPTPVDSAQLRLRRRWKTGPKTRMQYITNNTDIRAIIILSSTNVL